jgi:Flp pilus assembly protein TadD
VKVVHHCNLLIDHKETSRRRDGENGVPGFDGMDVELESDTFQPDSHFIYWKPGSLPYFEPENMTWELDPGTDLVLNMHLRPSGKPEAIRPQIGIYFSPHAPTVKPILMQLDRDDGLDIPAGAKTFELDDDFTLPVAVEVLAIYPHAHYLGHDLKAYATLPGGARKELIHIRNWDPSWQGVFRYQKPIPLPKGTVISMRYTFDNSADNPRNPNSPPKRVEAGNQSTDEMCHLWLQVVPETTDGSDGRRPLLEALMRHKLDRFLSDYAANYNLAALLLSKGESAEAVRYFKRAVAASDSSAALNGLGAALVAQEQFGEAVDVLRRAVAADPTSLDAHFNLASALAETGQFPQSAKEFAWVVEHKSNDAEAEAKYGTVLAELKDYDSAEAHFRRALAIDPKNELAQQSLEMLEQARKQQ